jgi:two-component system, OmpR family, KDP operon response regulator KdpE
MRASPRILVIAADPVIRKLLCFELTTQEYQVMDAADGTTALGLLGEKPDLIILDLGMTDIPGLDLLRRARDLNGTAPIFVLSDESEEARKVQALDLGADDYVTKPFGIKELLARLRAILRRQTTREELAISGAVGRAPLAREGIVVDALMQRRPSSEKSEIHLTEREREVLTWAARGKTSAEIAAILGVRERTVNFHCDRAMRRLDVTNRTQAVAKAIAQGLASL